MHQSGSVSEKDVQGVVFECRKVNNLVHVAYFEGLNKHVANIVVVLRPSERLCGPVNVRQVVVAAVPVGTARVCVNHVFDGFTQIFHVDVMRGTTESQA